MTHAERIRLDLADQILSGRRSPGAVLDENTLAREYNASRTPVREALRLLAASGLVAHRPHRGAEVAAPSAQDLRDMFQVMAELESLCAGHAARQMTRAERDELASAHHAMSALVRDGDATSYAKANEHFHGLIYCGSHNGYLAEITLQTRQRLRPFRRAQFGTLGRLAGSLAEHEAIVQAILRGDQAGARQAMAEHIGVVRDAFLALTRTNGAAS